MTNALEHLTPEMQERLAQIMAGQQAKAAAQAQPVAPTQIPVQPPVQQAPPAPPVPPAPKPLSLMDHIISLRQEVAQLTHQAAASAQVTEAVGHAVAKMYQMFQATEQPTSGSTYSQNFQTKPVEEDSDY